jgi:hypothetical protein
MAVYVDTPEGRVLLDTAKAHLQYEEATIDLTGATLSFYDQEWTIQDGTMGDDNVPCKVLVFTDPFTHLRIEIPVLLEPAKLMGKALDNGKRSLRRRLLN